VVISIIHGLMFLCALYISTDGGLVVTLFDRSINSPFLLADRGSPRLFCR